jgi:ATP-binding protein involved in chromosome partitioning
LIFENFIFETHDALYSDFLSKNKLSISGIMTEKKAEISQAMKEKLAPKKFIKNPIKGAKYTLLISSAKGGVGKSTFAVNIAFAFQNMGLKIGILDADVYGPSLPKLMKLNEKPKSKDGKYLIPLEKYNAQCMSMGFLVDETTPMIWRGPMVISAIKTMTENVLLKELDIIIIDMPPGTGDTQLTFAQQIKINGAVIVSTPQDLALLDVKRGIEMFDKTGVKILGLVDNMSFFKGDDGKIYNIFGEGGVEKTAKDYGKEFLGKIPIHQDLKNSNDKGDPLTHSSPEHEISILFKKIAEKIKKSIPE